MKITGIRAIIGTLCALAVSSEISQANVIFNLGNLPQPNEENVLFSGGTSGTTVVGNGNQSGIGVAFSSLTDTLTVPSSGQARIASTDGLLNSITVNVPGGFFGDLIVNPFKGSGVGILTVVDTDLSTFTFSYGLGTGNNFVTITTSGGESLDSVKIDSASGFDSLVQPRISDVRLASSVPDAGSCLTLLAASMFGLNWVRRLTSC